MHIRSSDIRRHAPSFHKWAASKIEEFLLLTPCVGTRICKNMEDLTPEDFFDRQPLAYVHEAVLGHPVKLKCPTRFPTQIMWYFNNKPLVPTQQVFINKAQVGIASVNANNSGNYSCLLVVTEDNQTTLRPQGFVYLKLSTSMAEIHFYMALYDLAALFILLLVIQLPLSCVTPIHKWYKIEARRYTLMISTLYRVKKAIENMAQPGKFKEARKIQQLRVIMEAIEKKNICDMVQLQERLGQRLVTAKDDEEWLNLLSSEIWKLQNATKSQAVV